MGLAQILLTSRPYPSNMTTLYIIQILINITFTIMTITENYILHNFIEHNELQKQSIHNLKHNTCPIEQQNVITTSKEKTINSMINIHNPPSLPNITLYKLYFPDLFYHRRSLRPFHRFSSQQETTIIFYSPNYLYKKNLPYIKQKSYRNKKRNLLGDNRKHPSRTS